MQSKAPHAVAERLRQAIDELHRHVHHVEMWAGALGAFAQPVPDYKPDDSFLLQRLGGRGKSR